MTESQAAATLAGGVPGASAVAYPCYFEGVVRDRATGTAIKGANVTFGSVPLLS
jgi:hypothetical protein